MWYCGSVLSDLCKRREGSADALDLHYEHDRIPAWPGQTVALALIAAGELETSRSVKYRRPRGAYCLRGDCGSCLMRIDGQPNIRACLTAVTPHLAVEPQNRLLESGPDPSRIVDKVMRGGMDHHHFMVRPRIANQIMQGVARGLTGLGTLPDRAPDEDSEHRVHRPDVLVVGGGPAGHGVVEALARGTVERQILWVDRRPAPPGETRAERTESLLHETGVFGVYPDEGLIAATTRAGRSAPILHTIRPRHVVFATGATDPTIPVTNNDLPGVVSARGLLEQLRRSGTRLACSIVVIGDGPLATSAAAALGCPKLATDEVEAIVGSTHVEGVETRADGKSGKIEVDLVALAPRPSPSYELARQGGADVRWNDAGFAVVRDDDGRCRSTGPWTAWVCGDAAGYPEAAHEDDAAPRRPGDVSGFGRGHDTAARADGQRIGSAVLAALREEAR